MHVCRSPEHTRHNCQLHGFTAAAAVAASIPSCLVLSCHQHVLHMLLTPFPTHCECSCHEASEGQLGAKVASSCQDNTGVRPTHVHQHTQAFIHVDTREATLHNCSLSLPRQPHTTTGTGPSQPTPKALRDCQHQTIQPLAPGLPNHHTHTPQHNAHLMAAAGKSAAPFCSGFIAFSSRFHCASAAGPPTPSIVAAYSAASATTGKDRPSGSYTTHFRGWRRRVRHRQLGRRVTDGSSVGVRTQLECNYAMW